MQLHGQLSHNDVAFNFNVVSSELLVIHDGDVYYRNATVSMYTSGVDFTMKLEADDNRWACETYIIIEDDKTIHKLFYSESFDTNVVTFTWNSRNLVDRDASRFDSEYTALLLSDGKFLANSFGPLIRLSPNDNGDGFSDTFPVNEILWISRDSDTKDGTLHDDLYGTDYDDAKKRNLETLLASDFNTYDPYVSGRLINVTQRQTTYKDHCNDDIDANGNIQRNPNGSFQNESQGRVVTVNGEFTRGVICLRTSNKCYNAKQSSRDSNSTQLSRFDHEFAVAYQNDECGAHKFGSIVRAYAMRRLQLA